MQTNVADVVSLPLSRTAGGGCRATARRVRGLRGEERRNKGVPEILRYHACWRACGTTLTRLATLAHPLPAVRERDGSAGF